MAGLTAEGFVAKTFTEIGDEIAADFRAAWGASLPLGPKTVLGQIKDISAERLAELWELGEAVNSEANPDNASGARLDAIAALTGTLREAASKSTATLTATGDAGTELPAGRVASVEDTGVRFATDADATIAAVDAWAEATSYALGDRVTNGSSPSRVYECTQAGDSDDPSDGPTSTDETITDGTCEWRYLGDGEAAVDVAASAEDTGPKVALSGTLNTIETPVSGWLGAINVEDAEEGVDVETDANLRLRREDEIRGGARGANPAIRAAILKVEDVETCTVFGNRTMDTDGDGRPPKSVECLVLGGDDEAVRLAVFENVAEGIETYGDNSGTVTDSQGIDHTIAFSRPDEIDVYVTINVTKYANEFPPDGEDQIIAAILALGALFTTGKNVVSSALKACGFRNPATRVEIEGVLDVTACYIGTAPAPAMETTIAIGVRELAKFDSSRITVNLSDGTP